MRAGKFLHARADELARTMTTDMGRELGDMGIRQFVNKKLVCTHDAKAPA